MSKIGKYTTIVKVKEVFGTYGYNAELLTKIFNDNNGSTHHYNNDDITITFSRFINKTDSESPPGEDLYAEIFSDRKIRPTQSELTWGALYEFPMIPRLIVE